MSDDKKFENINQGTSNEDLLQLVSFILGDEVYGVEILYVQEINRMVNITKVPNLPEHVKGVINLRGRVIPVIDLRLRMNLPAKEYDKETRIIVVEIESKIIGFIVDRVIEVLRIDKNITEPPPSVTAGINTEYLTSIAKLDDQLVSLLDLRKLLTEEEKDSIFESAAATV